MLKKAFKTFRSHFEKFGGMLKKHNLKQAYSELNKSYKALNNYKILLEKRVVVEVEKRRIHELILVQQTRFAAMGEMMDAVAHQWSQPLCIIGMHVDMIAIDYKVGKVDQIYIDEVITAINQQKIHMQSTLNDFRNFFDTVNLDISFDLNSMILNTLKLLNDDLLQNQIKVDFVTTHKVKIKGLKNEIQHVLINLLNNARDAYNLKKIKHRIIRIKIMEKSGFIALRVEDNAGGIENSMMIKLFKPYTTTKKSKPGSGIGLYMSNLIMQKYHGSISVKNHRQGALFILKFYKEK